MGGKEILPPSSEKEAEGMMPSQEMHECVGVNGRKDENFLSEASIKVKCKNSKGLEDEGALKTWRMEKVFQVLQTVRERAY